MARRNHRGQALCRRASRQSHHSHHCGDRCFAWPEDAEDLSSRAITSPAGTADTMETMAPVELDTTAIRRVSSGKADACVGRRGQTEPRR